MASIRILVKTEQRYPAAQKQRIAIARAWVPRDPEILILTKPLRFPRLAASEQYIRKMLTPPGARKTVIMITHRLSSVSWPDKIVGARQG